MHRLPQPVPVSGRDDLEFDRAQQAAPTITTHHHRNFAPMAFESSDPEATSLTSLSDIIDNLPSAVKSSLGPLNTIRRSVSIRGWASYFYEISSNTMGATASHLEGPSAGAASHRTTVVSRTTSTTAVEMQQHSNRGEKRVAVPAHAQAHTHRRQPEPPIYEEPDQNFGINRFCGLQGQLLVNNALSEGRPSTVHGHPAAGRIDRKAYVQGVAWLVHGLPDDLDKHERTELIRAMPPALLEEAHRTPVSQQPATPRPPYPPSSSSVYGYFGGGSAGGVGGVGDAGLALAQRFARAIVVQLLVPLHMLWAYVVLLLGRAVQLEREYKVAEQVVKHSGELGVGHLVTNVVAYTADGLVKGISDGIREARTERRRVDGED
ncbi:hypothetical protein INS49_000679 [Diaporthe citri]|uniref:uncharacterized protein n=1 Tax=Diaporthe citri TaxID=83186 RepID=UPI001C824D7A|nr:uncharacterized protein INS49_000679 [Diaporthe citri]KAG6366502.1 hypothetical protein INS49_000679 [Diaporthe citri]